VPNQQPARKVAQEDAFDELENLLATMSRSIVDYPDDVVIQRAPGQGFVAFEVWCRESDGGHLLGKRGSNADAIRTVMMAAGTARRVRVSINVLTRDGDHIGGR